MHDVTLEQLLEAGCHFGHKAERWHPKANSFIWQEKDGIHIIDLVKTKAGLDSAMAFISELAQSGGKVIFVGTKRQARGVVREAAQNAGANFLTQRWIGGFMTNWEAVKKNIQKVNKMMEEEKSGAWKKFPKHEQMKMSRYVQRLNVDYAGVLGLTELPKALFVVDVRKEQLAVREAQRMGIPVVGMVDTNADPSLIDYVIPANDDAVGSVELIVNAIAEAYREGREKAEKEAGKVAAAKEKAEVKPAEEAKKAVETPKAADKKTEKPAKAAATTKEA